MQHHSGDVKQYTIQYLAAVLRVTGPCDTAVSLVSFNGGRGTAAVPVAHTELQASDTAAVSQVTRPCTPVPQMPVTTYRRLQLVDELAGPSGNMGFGWGKQRNNVQCP